MTLRPVTGPTRRAWRRALLPLVGGLVLACTDGTSPSPREHMHRLLVPGSEDAAGIVVDLDRGSILRRIAPGKFVEQTHAVLSPDGTQLIVIGRMENGEWLLAGFGVQGGQELWHQTLAIGDQPAVVDGVELGRSALAHHPTRPEVFLSRSNAGPASGVAIYDYASRRVVDLVSMPTGRVRKLLAVSNGGAEACLVAATDTGMQASTRAFVVAACGPGYGMRDTVTLTIPSQVVVQMELTPDGGRIILGTNTELILIDPAVWQVARRAARPLTSPFFTSRADGRVYVADAGNSTVASSGIVFVLDAGLELATIYDLGNLSLDERPSGIHGGTVSADGRWVYLVGGVDRVGSAYGPEETRVFILDPSTGMLVDRIALGTLGGGPPFLIP